MLHPFSLLDLIVHPLKSTNCEASQYSVAQPLAIAFSLGTNIFLRIFNLFA
jgi:hypothetical protein